MNEIHVTDSQGVTKSIAIDSGLSLMEHLRGANYDEVQALCGGTCSCATCHVHIIKVAGDLLPIEEDEQVLLEMADDYEKDASRLSCQIELNENHDGLKVQLLKDGF